MEPGSIRVPAADGLSLHALEWSSEGVPLLLLHGFGNEAHVWDDVAPAVAPYYRTLALDWRGHGDSDRDPERRYDYADHLRDLEAATAALGIDRVVLVGHSLGGRVATLFAGAHPDRMAGLVIVDSGPELDARGTVRIRLEIERTGQSGGGGDGAGPSFASVAEYRSLMAHNYPAASPAALERLVRHGLCQREDGRFVPKLDAGYFASRSARSDAEMKAHEEQLTKQLWDALARVPCPTLVVRGAASDVLSPETADRMVDDVLLHGRLTIVPRAGHSVMIDNPVGTREAIESFVLGDD